MTFATWWRGDIFPELTLLPTYSVQHSIDRQLITQLSNQSIEVINNYIQRGDTLYIAFMGKAPAAYGWVAKQTGSIDELELTFTLPNHTCYLYNFCTLPHWRGQGIYPRLLQSILKEEVAYERFWIGYISDNYASARGISKAGFRPVSDLIILENRVSGLILFDKSEQAQASKDVFQLPIVSTSK